MIKRAFANRDLAAAGLLAVAGYTVAAFKLAGLSWDGSWYLFRSLQDRVPFIPHLRYGTYPVLWLLVQASKTVHDPAVLGVGYGLLLALFPVGALAMSWWFLRGEDRAPLRIWPTLGILLVPLPGQFCLMSEATPAAQLLWPILSIVAAGPPGVWGGLCLLLLSAALGFLHPTATFIFAVAAGLSVWQGWVTPGLRRPAWIWGATFAFLTAGQVLLTFFSVSEYERSQASWRQVWAQFNGSVLGYPLLLLLLTYLFGLVLLKGTGTARRPLGVAILVVIAGAGLPWAADPVRWSGLLDYRRFVLPAMLPLVALAGWHHHALRRKPETTRQPTAWALPWVSAAFGVVLVTQSFSWASLLARFNREVSHHSPPERFVTADELPFTQHTALRHWTACPLSILLQGRQPTALFVLKPRDIGPSSVRVNAWEQIPLIDGWFELRPLSSQDEGTGTPP